jgi:hypothetical protein
MMIMNTPHSHKQKKQNGIAPSENGERGARAGGLEEVKKKGSAILHVIDSSDPQ